MTATLDITRDGAVARVYLNRPDVRNAFNDTVIAELTALEDVVLATGGGAILAPESRRHLGARGTVVYLHALPEALYERVRQDKNRPLLATADPKARLRELYAERDPLYRSIADVVIDTGKQGVAALARDLLGKLGERWKASA